MLARMREDVAARAARHAPHAGRRRKARELYERVRQDAGQARSALPPWLRDEEPQFLIW
jgi:hypothetical protein